MRGEGVKMTFDEAVSPEVQAPFIELMGMFPEPKPSLLWLNKKFGIIGDCKTVFATGTGGIKFSIFLPGSKVNDLLLALRTGDIDRDALYADFIHDTSSRLLDLLDRAIQFFHIGGGMSNRLIIRGGHRYTFGVRRFVCYFFFVGWDCISFGLHVSFSRPNIEIHLPFGFFRIGWETSSEIINKGKSQE